MRQYRLLEIRFSDLAQLFPVHEWQLSHEDVLTRHCIQIVYAQSATFEMRLYGFDESLKWSSRKVSDMNNLDQVCSQMAMPCLFKRPSSANPCGLAVRPSTSHCFNDDTHRTCCLLGPRARRYADASGNPIGRASEQAFYETFGFWPDEKMLTPWCTCIGSDVCTFYANKFGDGTHIKYIDSQEYGRVLERDESKYKTRSHRTPGVEQNLSRKRK